MSIQWNAKGTSYLSPLQRDAIERGLAPRRLAGTVKADLDGRVWYSVEGHRKLVGELASSAAPSTSSSAEDAAERDLDAPPSASRKVARKRPAKKAAKKG
jgi:hypothetical protein